MKCSKCGGSTKVLDSQSDEQGSVYRKRVCTSCDCTFYTEEKYMPNAKYILNALRNKKG